MKFSLGDSSGAPISDVAALSLLSPVCLMHVTFDGRVMGCASYNVSGDFFQFNVKVPKSTSLGTHVIEVLVSASDGSGIVHRETTTVVVRR